MTLATEFAELFEKITDFPGEVVVLTPNKRLSRFVRKSYNQYQVKKQRKAWPSLGAFSLQAWVQLHWDKLSFAAYTPENANARSETLNLLRCAPLTPFQERILWQRIVNHHPDTPALLSTKATAGLAMDAWQLLQRWQLGLPDDDSEDVSLLNTWCEAFEQECSKRQVVSSAQQASVVSECLQLGMLKPPEWCVLYGFDEHTPQLRRLINNLQAQGCKVETFEWGSQAQAVQRYEFQHEKSEIEASALWAKQLLQAQPHASIAIVVPKLASLRASIEQIFTRVFEAQYILPQQAQHAPGFNISAGQNFDSLPLVAAALNALACNGQYLDIEDISRLLRSPFIGSQAELNQRALIDLELRDTDTQIRLQQCIDAAGQIISSPAAEEDNAQASKLRCPLLHDSLLIFSQIAENANTALNPSQWAQVFQQQLQALAWPGERQLDTLEYQQLQRWHEALVEMAMLDKVCAPIGWQQALQYLRSLLQQISFQAQTFSSPIQILGVLEAASLPFDHLWLMNMDDETWPPQANPNPLLPLKFQIQQQMPQCSPQKELAYAGRLIEGFQRSAQQVVYSHAANQDDKQMRASTLVAAVAPQPFTLSPDPSMAEQLFAQRKIEASLDSCGPKIINPAGIRGGSAIIKDQSACPFQAFARHRLHAKAIPASNMGLDAKDRGILLHHVLELIWKTLRSQDKLLQLSEDELDTQIRQAISKSLRALRQRHGLGKRFLALEAERLAQQVRAWLELEKRREAFTVVSNEGRKTTKLAKLPLTVRYDRVDRLDDGSLLVLDYKTGKQQLRAWAGTRPEEPQVPLYCVINRKKISGGAFGQIAADEIAFKGIAEQADAAPGLKSPDMLFKLDLPNNWPDIIDHWKQVLEQLARDFMAGAAAVNPKHPATTCRFCELKPLCRIKEQFNLDTETDPEDSDDSASKHPGQASHEQYLELVDLD